MHSVFNKMIDFAGLFPPASLSMDEAMLKYAEHRGSTDRQMLARFVVAARRLHDLTDAAGRTRIRPPTFDPWPLAVVIGTNHVEDLARIERLRATKIGKSFRVDAVEARVHNVGEVSVVTERFRTDWDIFLELSHDADFAAMVPALRDAGAGAKIRTGGVSPESFPTPEQLASFLMAVYEYAVPWKATAGLHHLFTRDYRLTYDPDSPRHEMFGYLNLIFAATAVRYGANHETAVAILTDRTHEAFRRGYDYIGWREWMVSYEHIRNARINGFQGFGSCSFREPVDEMVMEFGR